MNFIQNEDSNDSTTSISSVSSRKSERRLVLESKTRVLFYFELDGSTALEEDVNEFINTKEKTPKKNCSYDIIWRKESFKVTIIKVGGSLEDCKAARLLFEDLKHELINIPECVELCESPEAAKARIREERNNQLALFADINGSRHTKTACKRNRRVSKISGPPSVPSIFPTSKSTTSNNTLGDVIRMSYDIETIDPEDVIDQERANNINQNCFKMPVVQPAPEVTHNNGPEQNIAIPSTSAAVQKSHATQQTPSTMDSDILRNKRLQNKAKDKRVQSLVEEISTAVEDKVKYEICMRYAALFSGLNKEPLVPSHPNVLLSRSDKLLAINKSKGNPNALQKELLLYILGKEYIASHSATGQRTGQKTGHPEARSDVLEAITLFVSHKHRGEKIEGMNAVFNRLAGNLRLGHKRKTEGKYIYPKKKKAAPVQNAPNTERAVLAQLENIIP